MSDFTHATRGTHMHTTSPRFKQASEGLHVHGACMYICMCEQARTYARVMRTCKLHVGWARRLLVRVNYTSEC